MLTTDRTLIADTAWRLFADRGFDAVPVAEVAREARVSEATVFNYFPRKEDLLHSRLEGFGERLVEAVDSRAPGESVLDAVRRFLLRPAGTLAQAGAGDGDALTRLRTINRLIAASPALRAREQQTIDDTTAALAARLAAEVREYGAKAFDLLAGGLDGHGVRRTSGGSGTRQG